jgi:hypothetical protein
VTAPEGTGSERTNLIASVRITPQPKHFGDPLPEVWVTTEDGIETMAFEYLPDELTFTEAELIGLTLEECRLLQFGRDRAFLQR